MPALLPSMLTPPPDVRAAMSPTYQMISEDVVLGRDVVIHAFVNLYGCEIGDQSRIGAFVEIQKGAKIGRRCKISSHTFICEGVTIEDEVFVGHNVTFTNDRFPRATRADGQPQSRADWTCQPTRVCRGASIGSGTTLLAGIVVGENALVGAGSVVTRDVAANAVVMGNPARLARNSPAQPLPY
jgi:acetyltransferase-like isoleucine patch superfamily enzyme